MNARLKLKNWEDATKIEPPSDTYLEVMTNKGIVLEATFNKHARLFIILNNYGNNLDDNSVYYWNNQKQGKFMSNIVSIPKYNQIVPYPPAGKWAPCHPNTKKYAVASFTCPYGHTIILKKHRVNSLGYVSPSVVCKECSFHEYIKLEDWEALHGR